MSDIKKLSFALGLAQKAGQLASGDTAVQFAVKSGKAYLLLLASDASENTKKYILSMAENNDVDVISCISKNDLGYAIGKAQRSAIAVLDENFSRMIKDSMKAFE